MSEDYLGPYQSRLLNFISKQSRQVADKCDRTWREVKLASLNAVQILLYPAYLLVQGSRMLSRQLRESKRQIDLPELQAEDDREKLATNLLDLEMDANSAISGILNLAQNLLVPAQKVAISDAISESISFSIESPQNSVIHYQQAIPALQNTATTQTIPVWGSKKISNKNKSSAAIVAQPQVWGIATFLQDRSLVLVGSENRVLDVLTPEQQELLSGRIVWEVANSGGQRREIAKKELEFNLGLESAAAQAKLLPLKRFWELMAWVQASPIALKRNQFGESILAVKQAVEKAVNAASNRDLSLTQKHLTPHASELSANFDSKFDLPIDRPSFVSLIDRTAANIETFSLPAVLKNTAGLTAAESGDSPTLSPAAKEILENYARRIENAIWSSVDYLLGKETAASDNTEKAIAIKYYLEQQALNNAEKTNSAGDRPWLNWQDLFGEPAPSIAGSSDTVGAVPPRPPASISLSQTSTKVKTKIEEIEALPEGRSTSIGISPYPEAIQTLLAQLKQSLLTTQVQKNQPQKPVKIDFAQPPKATAPAAAAKPANAISLAEAKTDRETEWLETKAESMGYVKHPLERALEWLDRIMVRLEKIAEQIWKWVKTHLLKAPNS